MLISHRHRFIFIKTAKTAGTSVELALSKFCGPDDVIPGLMPPDELIRRKLGYPGPQNNKLAKPWRIPYGAGRHFVIRKYISHAPARWLAEIAPDAWRDYLKFTIERNPWDKAVSAHTWHVRERPMTFERYLESELLANLHWNGWGVYTIKDRIAVDRVCRYEQLATDLEEIRKHLGLAEPLHLPRAKDGGRAGAGYRNLYSERGREIVARAFAKEIAAFGYQF